MSVVAHCIISCYAIFGYNSLIAWNVPVFGMRWGLNLGHEGFEVLVVGLMNLKGD